MSEIESIPLDIVFDILVKLPVESLRRCMRVCKSWRSLIADPLFINNQLLINQQDGFLLKSHVIFPNKSCSFLHCCKTFKEHKELKVPNVMKTYPYSIIGSCNGILCLLMIDQVRPGNSRLLHLWNPSIQKFKTLPSPRFPTDCFYDLAHGFAFIPRANDYKVVRLVRNDIKGSPEVEIYTLNTNSWRTWSGESSIRCDLTNYCCPAFVNGAVHWTARKPFIQSVLGTENRSLIVAFHMEDEVFREIKSPGGSPPVHSLHLRVITEKLACFVHRDWGYSWHMWVLEDYGFSDLWTKLHTISTMNWNIYPLQSLETGEVLFSSEEVGELLLFDVERQEFKTIVLDGLQSDVINLVRTKVDPTKIQMINYTESLVLLDEGIDDYSHAMQNFEEEVYVRNQEPEVGFYAKSTKDHVDAMDFLQGVDVGCSFDNVKANFTSWRSIIFVLLLFFVVVVIFRLLIN